MRYQKFEREIAAGLWIFALININGMISLSLVTSHDLKVQIVQRKGNLQITNTWFILNQLQEYNCQREMTSCNKPLGSGIEWMMNFVKGSESLHFWLVYEPSKRTLIGWRSEVKYLYCKVGEFCPKHVKYYFWTWIGAVHIELKTKQNTMVVLVEMSN